MRLEVRADGRSSPPHSRSRQLVAHRHAFGRIALRLLEREGAGAHHHRHEARAFFVGPDRDLERRGLEPSFERAHHLEAGEHAVVAVELAAGRLRVDVAAGMTAAVVALSRAARENLPIASTPTLQPVAFAQREEYRAPCGRVRSARDGTRRLCRSRRSGRGP